MTSKTTTPKNASPRTEQENRKLQDDLARINALSDLKEVVDLAAYLALDYRTAHGMLQKDAWKPIDAMLLKRFEAMLPHIFGDPCGAYEINEVPQE